MNTFMWEHPSTLQSLRQIERFGFVRVLQPVVKTLMCNDTGTGAMESVNVIAEYVMFQLAADSPTYFPPPSPSSLIVIFSTFLGLLLLKAHHAK